MDSHRAAHGQVGRELMSNGIAKHRSGQVIALGRALLATVFLFAIWVDPSQPANAAAMTYTLLASYIVIAAALLLFTWDNAYLEAKLAAPAHVFDIVVFTILVLATEGYTSPFFVFFVFILLSAAIRWGWRETAVTAVAVTFLYLAAGLVAGPAEDGAFELQRFIIRSGHLLAVSALLIWFGIAQSKRLQEEHELVAAELNHRIKNVLSVVNALITLTARSADSVENFSQSLRERLGAVADTHKLLQQGADRSADLRELIVGELAHYRGSCGTNVVLNGPKLAVKPEAGMLLGLAFHELATNSAKHGALSSPTGRVTVKWITDACGEPSLSIEWVEEGGHRFRRQLAKDLERLLSAEQ